LGNAVHHPQTAYKEKQMATKPKTVKYKTNTQLVTKLMSNPKSLMQAFVIEAIRHYAEATKDAPDWAEQGFISQEAWRECAKQALDTINYR
jgi:hypothetical protein